MGLFRRVSNKISKENIATICCDIFQNKFIYPIFVTCRKRFFYQKMRYKLINRYSIYK